MWERIHSRLQDVVLPHGPGERFALLSRMNSLLQGFADLFYHPPAELSAHRFSRHNSLIWNRCHKQSGTISLSPGRTHGGAVRSEI
ncbi:NADH dehydrogenase [Pseudomonas sp. TCU-HL1]|nr:NADH dehydrogenase [Pseudomonas sp. TCU-HL1]